MKKLFIFATLIGSSLLSASNALAVAQASYTCGTYKVELFGPTTTDVYKINVNSSTPVVHVESEDLSPLSIIGNDAFLIIGDTKILCKFDGSNH